MSWLKQQYLRFMLWLHDSTPCWFQMLIHLAIGAVMGVVALSTISGIVLEILFVIQNSVWLVPVAAVIGAIWHCRRQLLALTVLPVVFFVEAVQ